MKKRRHFVVRHDLASLEALPNYCWNTECGKDKTPHRYKEIVEGSRWVSYAYTSSDYSSDRLRYVTGFSTCVQPYQHGPIPLSVEQLAELGPKCQSEGWFIKGKPDGITPKDRVLVPSIDYFYDSRKFSQQAITPISETEYERIQEYVLSHQIEHDRIPILRREPQNEQEVLAILIGSLETLGIEQVLNVQQSFPDITLQLEGNSQSVRIELELYGQSYISHGHPEDKNVGVVCWLDDDPMGKGKKVRKMVHKVYELRTLLSRCQKLIW